ncbi:MAG: 2-oxo acid dehydrogenase subunit E2 [Acidobacteria bacterium]|nr:2-oxo acid dehydrogenase subunit E2 [Acidobacteriota bacterium]MYJ05830.1 2-oxo acid dehydrogenase subunit E2 [Acidobacteriota bacterium]
MATNVLMPQLGESIAEGTIVRWNKAVGESVDRDEPLFEVSTDKVDAEVPSPVGGVVAELRVQAGETVAVDSVVAVIAAPGAGVTAGVAPTPSPKEAAEAASEAPAGVAADEESSSASPPGATLPAHPATGGSDVRLSPVVRRLAREHGVDPADVPGTGGGGRVTREDILGHVAARGTEGAGAGAKGERVEPLSVMRQQIASHMIASRRTSAHVHTIFDVDFTHVAGLLGAHAEAYAARGIRLTYLSFVAKAVVDALGAVPIVNATLSEDGVSVRYRSEIGLGIAVALDGGEGLIVPVIRDAGAKSLGKLSQAIVDLATRAREKKLSPDEVQGGTFTITNPGVFGSIAGMPIINQPQAAILCIGAVERRPVVLDDDTITPRHRCYLTLGFDHRLIDGAIADRFMSVVKNAIEQFDDAQL